MAKRRVGLIPWDPSSPEHVQELFQQRVQCGWNSDYVEGWRTAQALGHKCIYWIPGVPLLDTCTSLNGKPVTPTGAQFQPVGHISLDPDNASAKDIDLGLPATGCYWIATFYVSTVLQKQGLGSGAMTAVEAMAALEPLCAKTLVLDTLLGEDQKREEIANAFFGGVPKVTNQEWYARRGYRLIKTVPNHYKKQMMMAMLGPDVESSAVFMRRDVA
ncbi:hypothetical protein Micbo1qcDRAFT_222093 [Microdochium bolleyi]|uniref:N-acetyltransferase domain-containing protein n=1 Tax=Microdochium bolleyi TaxID=196109 RepID=A0A136ILE8_9PEZI|nr:hypothetical protein Micbo1qcDRAFT_222093 [Microdochium bolleyi]